MKNDTSAPFVSSGLEKYVDCFLACVASTLARVCWESLPFLQLACINWKHLLHKLKLLLYGLSLKLTSSVVTQYNIIFLAHARNLNFLKKEHNKIGLRGGGHTQKGKPSSFILIPGFVEIFRSKIQDIFQTFFQNNNFFSRLKVIKYIINRDLLQTYW